VKNSEFFNLFLDEACEIIDRLGNNLVELEKYTNNTRLINEVFRDAHTMKGSSGAMGFVKIAEITHHMEDVLGGIKDGRVEPSPKLFTILLVGLDLIRGIIDNVVSSGSEGDVNIGVFLGKLDGLLKGVVEKKENNVRLKVVLSNSCALKSARALVILSGLTYFGGVVGVEPSTEVIEKDGFDGVFVVTMGLTEDLASVMDYLTNDIDVATSVVLGDVVAEEETVVEETTVKKVLSSDKQTSVRVDVKKLESLMNLVGELVIERNRLANIAGLLGNKYKNEDFVGSLSAISSRLGSITSDLQMDIMKARMIVVAQLFSTFPRLVRDVSTSLNKRVELVLLGTETEIDRTIAEELRDPLIHLIRNSVDHGVETTKERLANGKSAVGKVTISAAHEENNVVITIEDDGGGIDTEAVRNKAISSGLVSADEVNSMSDTEANNLIFLPGLSTASSVSNISGRGVGMDVVSSQIEKLGGSVEVVSQRGMGTVFRIRLPLTLAIIRGLLVSANGVNFCIPLSAVVETKFIDALKIEIVQDKECVVIRDQIIPIRHMHDIFKLGEPDIKPSYVVIVSSGISKVGFSVDRLIGEQEVVVKPLGRFFNSRKELSGATILGDGNVVPILDPKGLLSLR